MIWQLPSQEERKSDSLAEEEGKGYSGSDSALSSPKEPSDTSERGNSPVSTDPTPCLNGFLSQMGDVVSGSREALLPFPLALPLSQRSSPPGAYGSYSASTTAHNGKPTSLIPSHPTSPLRSLRTQMATVTLCSTSTPASFIQRWAPLTAVYAGGNRGVAWDIAPSGMNCGPQALEGTVGQHRDPSSHCSA